MEDLITKTIILNLGDPNNKRAEIKDYFKKTIALEEKLFETFASDDAFYLRSDPLRHPLVFYFGHTAVFYINKLILAKLLPQRVNSEFESIFAVGVDEMSWDDLNEKNYNWPEIKDVIEYRKQVWDKVTEMIDTLPLNIPIKWDDPFWVILMGIEHQRIHIETSTMLIRQLPLNILKKTDFWNLKFDQDEPVANSLVTINGKEVSLGKDYDHPLYGWDDEYGKEIVKVSQYQAGKHLVSNNEFLEFVKDGGYCKEEFWTEEGWQWRNFTKAKYPKFWIKNGDGNYQLRTFLEEIDLPWNWPVEVNYLEAKAFCNWKAKKTGEKYRMPTEAEYMALYESYVKEDQPDWEKAPGNINLEHYKSPCSVYRFNFGGVYDVIGNVWQWTESPISGYPGFKVHPYYDDFSAPTFDSRHNIFKGGAWISTGNEATKYARYAFRRHFFQYAGFRYIVSPEDFVISQPPYETDRDVALRCEFDYGDIGGENFAEKAVRFCVDNISSNQFGKVLNIGCSTGRSAFELAKYFDEVVALDFTARYIKMAIQLQETGLLKFVIPTEGDLEEYKEISLGQLNLANKENNITFWQGDAANLKPHFTGFDLIYVHDILDKMYDPGSVLENLKHRINPNGILIISSGYDWDESITNIEKWLGGIRYAGEPLNSLEGITKILEREFDLIKVDNSINYKRYINLRKFEFKKMEFSVWKKK